MGSFFVASAPSAEWKKHRTLEGKYCVDKHVFVIWQISGNPPEVAQHSDYTAAVAHRMRIVSGAENCRASFAIPPTIAVEPNTRFSEGL